MDNIETDTIQRHTEVAQTLLKNLQETLNEEKWTRATLGNYSANQFKELDGILKNAYSEKITDELKKNCDEHLAHTKNSIIALYISGMIGLSRQIIDDSAMINLVSIFLDNHKWSIVKYLCERMLDYGESKFALRTLADCYRNDNEENKITGIWERLVKVDFEEADITKSLAEHYEKQGNSTEAVDYYKKALHRYINKSSFSNVKEVWEKLININSDDIDFFLHIQKKIAKSISEDKAVNLLNELYSVYKVIDIDIAINILKIILEYDEKDVHGRREIIDCFRKKYSSHSQIDEYIRISNLSQNYRDVHQAISDFERHIAFDKGNFIYHKTWGVGRIAKIEGDNILIDFSKKRSHSMSLKMGVEALQTLSKDHIWVLKATKKKDELKQLIKDKDENIIWALKTVIRSFSNACDMKKIKQELFPALLTAAEWTAWSGKARDILKSNPEFGVKPDNSDIYVVIDKPVSVTEKLYNEFTALKNIYDRINAFRDYTNNKNAEPDSDFFQEMFSYFTDFLQPSGYDEEYSLVSYLVINELSANKNYSHLLQSVTVNFIDIFSKINDVTAFYKKIKDLKLKTGFLENIKQYIDEWPDIYITLFPFSQVLLITEQLEKAGFTDKLTQMCKNCFEYLHDNREAVVWLYKNSSDTPWFKTADINVEKQLISLIHILDITYRDIENHKDTLENRKTNKLVHNILFKAGSLSSFIDKFDEDAVIRVFSFINNVKDLDPQDKLNLRSKILDKYPGFKFIGDTEKKISRGLVVTKAMYEEKKKQLAHIMDYEVPVNSKEIEYALSLGDLRENAEYKAAKEKQDQLNSQAAKLKEEIDKAQLYDPNFVNTSRVSFGTKVILHNEITEKKEEYTILGPWESDPNNNIISYLSPFGSVILNKVIGEKFDFITNTKEKSSYLVENIAPAGS
jgi:transcription elongation factor GreA